MPVKRRKKGSKKITAERKRRVRKHIIADLSANYVERFALLNGFSVECISKDYGYDLNVNTFNSRGELQNGIIYIQLKATDHIKYLSGRLSVSLSISKKDINAWYLEPFPVILVLYDALKDVAYWLYVQQYLENLPNFELAKIKNNFSVRIPIINRINEQSFRQFREYKLRILKQLARAITHK